MQRKSVYIVYDDSGPLCVATTKAIADEKQDYYTKIGPKSASPVRIMLSIMYEN